MATVSSNTGISDPKSFALNCPLTHRWVSADIWVKIYLYGGTSKNYNM